MNESSRESERLAKLLKEKLQLNDEDSRLVYGCLKNKPTSSVSRSNNDGDRILDLSRSRTSRAFNKKESLWGNEIDRVMELVEQHICSLKGQETLKENVNKTTLSIAIFGTYGSGKSSLLYTLREHINEVKGRNIYALPVIEPNILNSKDHFLYSFLANALNEEHQIRKQDNPDEENSQVVTPLLRAFQDVSHDLQVVDDFQKSTEDPHEMSMSRLERHHSGLSLKRNLDLFLDELANVLGGGNNSVVLMPVDDADMAKDELINTLDTLRRYLQHPRLVPIFSFTGRLAEELLRVHFEGKLRIGDNGSRSGKLMETATSIEITESLALQYLGKLFPVRNRIRLGYAAARAQSSQYIQESGGEGSVKDLLERASQILFGFSEWPIQPSIHSPLRAATLRRQLQIVDALNASNINFLHCEKGERRANLDNLTLKEIFNRRDKSWPDIFDAATWALLNVHRDILREYELNLDDLYSWTPVNLRQVVLAGVLNKKFDIREKMLKQWRYRAEDRRCQMLSLMAANVFRPRMIVEETTGDDPHQIDIRKRLKSATDFDPKDEKLIVQAYATSISTRESILWFLNLWLGFYLPQILVLNNADRKGRYGKPDSINEANSIGWDLEYAPIQAMQLIVSTRNIYSTGAMRLDENEVSKAINVANQNDDWLKNMEKVFLTYIWCFFGYDHGQPWAAVSFWRGLGLLGQLLKVDIEMRASFMLDNLYETPKKRHDRIRKVIMNHFKNGRVMCAAPEKGEFWSTREEFSHWRFERNEGDSYKREHMLLDILTDDVISWLDEFDPEFERIYPVSSGKVLKEDKELIKWCLSRKSKRMKENFRYLIVDCIKKLSDVNLEGSEIDSVEISCITDWCKKVLIILKEDDCTFEKMCSRINQLKDAGGLGFDVYEIISGKGIKINDENKIEFDLKNKSSCLLSRWRKLMNLQVEDGDCSKKNREGYRIVLRFKRALEECLRLLCKLNSVELEADKGGSDFIELDEFDYDKSNDEDEQRFRKYFLNKLDWESCFIRRLHGDNLMSNFWQNLESVYFENKLGKLSMHVILTHWCSVLVDYWSCGRKYYQSYDLYYWTKNPSRRMIKMIGSCPFISPFNKRDNDGGPQFEFCNLGWDKDTLEGFTSYQNEPKDQKKYNVEIVGPHKVELTKYMEIAAK